MDPTVQTTPTVTQTPVMTGLADALFNQPAPNNNQPAPPQGGAPNPTYDPNQPAPYQAAQPALPVDPSQMGVGLNGMPLPPAQDQNATVPLHRFQEVTAARREAERQIYERDMQIAEMKGMMQAFQNQQQQAQQQQAPVDPNPIPGQFQNIEHFAIQDPAGYAQWVHRGARIEAENAIRPQLQQLADQQQQMHQGMVRDTWKREADAATQQHGAETVKQVTEWVKANNLGNRYSYDPDGRPRTDAMQRAIRDYRTVQLRSAIPNGDINAYNARIVQEALRNPQVLQQLAPHLMANRPGVSQAPAVIPPPLSGQPTYGVAQHAAPFSTGRSAVGSMFAEREARGR